MGGSRRHGAHVRDTSRRIMRTSQPTRQKTACPRRKWRKPGGDFPSIITTQAIRRGSFTSVKDLITAILIDGCIDHSQPFV